MHVVDVEKKRKKIIRKNFSLISSQPTPLIWQFNMPLWLKGAHGCMLKKESSSIREDLNKIPVVFIA